MGSRTDYKQAGYMCREGDDGKLTDIDLHGDTITPEEVAAIRHYLAKLGLGEDEKPRDR